MKKEILIIIGILFLITITIVSIIASQEKKECKQWQNYQGMYEGFYTMEWQKSQCENYNIYFEN